MKVDQAKRLKEVEVENARLKKLVADLCLDMAIFEDCAEQVRLGASERQACSVLGQHRSIERKRLKDDTDERL